jgi:predicted unusual protein kinase regulating ubiquinone biosynthesis (AarF/ABC1/UbiB family)
MRDDERSEHDANTSAVPGGRWSRLVRLGALAGGVAGSMLAEGTRQFAQGKRPRISDLLLTPANARRVADQLAQLRGAAMKFGQLLSMDAGDLLPPEFGAILARLRADARAMPMSQLASVLDKPTGGMAGTVISGSSRSRRWRQRRSARSIWRRRRTGGAWP